MSILAHPPTLANPLVLPAPLCAALSEQAYARVLACSPRHPLVRLARAGFDPAPVVAAAAGFYHACGPGAPPTYSLAVLVRAELVRLWAASCSDRTLERLLASDLLVRWFCTLGLLDPTPDHATLNRFHAWLADHAPAALFAHVLAFLDRVDPEDPATTPQIADTFALATPAAPTSASEILRGLTAQAVAAWRPHAPANRPDPLAALDLAPLTRRPPLYTPAQRRAALRQAASLATAVRAALLPHLPALLPAARHPLQHLLDLLAKVLADETTTDPTSGAVDERPARDKGAYRLGSPVDTEATFRKHGDKPAVFGYNAALSTSPTRIRAAFVVTGCTPDSETPVALLEQQKAAGLPLPAKLVMDQAAGAGKTRAAVAAVSAGQTAVVARTPPSGGPDPMRFGPADFVLSADGQQCRCPNGVVSSKAYPSGEADGVHFRFTGKQCAGCPLWRHCRPEAGKPTANRMVYVSPYGAFVRRAAAFNATAEGQELLGQRWQVEATIAWLVRYDGCRRARRKGRAAAQFHLLQCCAARNLWRWLARRARRTAGQEAATGGVCP